MIGAIAALFLITFAAPAAVLIGGRLGYLFIIRRLLNGKRRSRYLQIGDTK